MEPLCRVKFDITPEDIIAVHIRTLRKSPVVEHTYRKNRRNGIAALVIVAGGFAAVAYFSAADPNEGTARAVTWVVIYAFLWPVYAAVYLRRAALRKRFERNTRELVLAGKVPFSPWAEFLVYPDRLEIREPDEVLAKAWATVQGVAREADGVYIDFAGGSSGRVPARAFASEAEMIRFIDEIERREAGRGENS